MFDRAALAGLVLTTVTNVFMAASFGSAAFVQPGIGRAHLDGVDGVPAMRRPSPPRVWP